MGGLAGPRLERNVAGRLADPHDDLMAGRRLVSAKLVLDRCARIARKHAGVVGDAVVGRRRNLETLGAASKAATPAPRRQNEQRSARSHAPSPAVRPRESARATLRQLRRSRRRCPPPPHRAQNTALISATTSAPKRIADSLVQRAIADDRKSPRLRRDQESARRLRERAGAGPSRMNSRFARSNASTSRSGMTRTAMRPVVPSSASARARVIAARSSRVTERSSRPAPEPHRAAPGSTAFR